MVIVTVGILCINGADVQAHGLSWGLVCGFLSAVCFALLVIAMKKVSGIGGILSPACQLLVASLVVAAVTLSMPTAPVSLDMTQHRLHGLPGHRQHRPRLLPLFLRRPAPIGPERLYLRLHGTLYGPGPIGHPPRRKPDLLQWLGAACILGGVALSELWHPGKRNEKLLLTSSVMPSWR